MNTKEIFGENLKYFRKQKQITQEELSERLGITPNHLSRIENGKSFITAELLDTLCVVFEITPAVFFYTPHEFSGDESLFTKIDNVIDTELEKLGILLKEKIRR